MYFKTVLIFILIFLTSCAGNLQREEIVETEVENTEKDLPLTTPFNLADYKIAAGDQINIDVFGEPDLQRQGLLIPQNGIIEYPLIGEVQIIDLTVKQAASLIQQKLAEGFFYQPQVTVTIEKYRPVIVAGDVENSGVHDYRPAMTLRMALVIAGDEYDWPVKNIIIQRDNVKLNPSSIDELVAPGDLIIFESNLEVITGENQYYFLDGEVRSPGRYSLDKKITVEQAIISAGGFTSYGSKKRIFVRQAEKDKMEKVKLTDYVRNGDVILVKQRFF